MVFASIFLELKARSVELCIEADDCGPAAKEAVEELRCKDEIFLRFYIFWEVKVLKKETIANKFLLKEK